MLSFDHIFHDAGKDTIVMHLLRLERMLLEERNDLFQQIFPISYNEHISCVIESLTVILLHISAPEKGNETLKHIFAGRVLDT